MDGGGVRESGEQIFALKPPTARRAVVDLLSIGFARVFIIEENPLVAPFSPPELSPPVRVPARTDNIAWPPVPPREYVMDTRTLS